jgi:Zn-dependent protease with chaperone function
MTQAATLPSCQVTLDGTRLKDISDAELIAQLAAKLRLSPQQAGFLLEGRRTVKRGIDLATAERLVRIFAQIGLKAVIEQMPSQRAIATPPTATDATAQPTTAEQRDPLAALRALGTQRLPKPRTSGGYSFGLLLVTLLCVTMPVIYLCLMAGIATGWVWYLTHIHHHLPRNIHLILLMYGVPGLAGGVLVLFLLRPVFARRPRAPDALTIDASKEPGLVEGVHALCRAIGVSPPAQIQLSWDANASVHFRNGWSGVLTGRKVLTIGLALVAGLSAQQFVGVLAHEFGHFAQRFGMMCSYIVNSVNAWLEHCAYGEDEWEQRLRGWGEEADAKENGAASWLVSWCVAATLLAIWLMRRLMAGLFQLSFRLTQHMSRQMEFDADRYEALVAGSDTFRLTARTLRGLNYAFREVNRANIAAWRENRLLRNMPEAVATRFGRFDSKQLASIDEEVQEATTTRYWDSHPPDAARIENAERQRSPGLYRESAPATLMFRDFRGWCERATRLFYREQEVEFDEATLRNQEEILGLAQERDAQREQLARFFNGQFQPWPLISLTEPPAGAEAPAQWQAVIDRIRARSPELTRAWQKANAAEESRPLLRIATAMNLTSQQVGLTGALRTHQALSEELGLITARRMECHTVLAEGFGLYALRIKHAIASMPAAERERATTTLGVLLELCTLGTEVAAIEELIAAVGILQGRGPEQVQDTWLQSVGELAAQALTKADRIAQKVTIGETVGGYLRSRCPLLPPAGTQWEAKRLAQPAWPLPAAFHEFYLLALGELLSACEVAEKAQGIRPIRLVAAN